MDALYQAIFGNVWGFNTTGSIVNSNFLNRFSVDGSSVLMSHNGYVFRFFNILIPMPLGLLLGKCHVVERQISEDTFSMEMSLNHFLFGKIYEYRGIFKITEETK